MKNWNQLILEGDIPFVTGNTLGLGNPASDSFGRSVSFNSRGDTLIVSAHTAETNTIAQGVVYVYVVSGTQNNWMQVSRISGENNGDQFGISTSLNWKGDILAIGAPFNDPTGIFNAGAAYIYTGSGNNWKYAAKITGDTLGLGNPQSDLFGRSVSLNAKGNVLAVGANVADTNTVNIAGAVYLFTGSGSGWTQLARLTGNTLGLGNPAGDQFGWSTSLNSDGNVLAVGAYNADTTGVSAGAVYIFTGIEKSWVQTARLTGDTLGLGNPAGDQFGISTSLNSAGNVLAVGAHLADTNAVNSAGAVYLFTGVGNSWVQTARLTGDTFGSGNPASDLFGVSTSLNSLGNILTVGANAADTTGVSAGAVYLFTGSGSSWVQTARLTGNNRDFPATTLLFGESTILNSFGNILAVGAPNTTLTGLANAGATYLFTGDANFQNQIISFPLIPLKRCGDIFDPAAISNSNLPIQYESNNSGFAIVTGNLISILTVGTGIITARQSGDNFYFPAQPVSRFLEAVKGEQIINFANITKKIGDPVFILTGKASTNLPLTYYLSGTPGVATLLNNSSIAIQSTGQISILGVQSGNSCYNSSTGIALLSINKGDQTIFFNAIPIKYTNNPPFLLNVFSTAGLPITITGDYVPIANITNLLVTLSGAGFEGQGNIFANQTGNNFYNPAATVSRILKVNNPIPSTQFDEPCVCGAIDISAGTYHNTVLLKNYRVTGWGNNDYLQKDFPNYIKYAYNISAGNNYSQAIMKSGINTGVINEYIRFPDGYGLFESQNGIGKSNILGGTFNFPWISTGTYNEILGYADPLSGSCLHPIDKSGEFNYGHLDDGALPYNTMIQDLTALAPLRKPAINIISVNNLPPGLSLTGKLGPINPNLILNAPKAFPVKVAMLGFTGLYGPLYKEYKKNTFTSLISDASGFFATGRNNYNQSETFNFTGIKSVIAGKDCSFVIFQNGKITGWGESLFGENLSTISSNFLNVKEIASKGNHTLVLFENNRTSGFGLNTFGQTTNGNNLTGVSGIAVGINHSLAILYNGRITGWGANNLNQTSGTSTFYSLWSQTPVGKISNATKISAGAYHNLICLNDRTITGYGDDSYSKISRGLFLTGVIDVSAGENHSLALLDNGRVTGWGSNQFAQVSGTLSPSLDWESTPVGILSGVKAISTSYNHNLALLNNGRVTGWGLNDYKQHLRINTNEYLTGIINISAGKSHSLFSFNNSLGKISVDTDVPLEITGNLTGFGITGSGIAITGYNTPYVLFINQPIGLKDGYIPSFYSITGNPNLAGNYNTYFLIHEPGANTEYSERYMTFTVLETGRFPTLFKVCGGTIGLIDQILN